MSELVRSRNVEKEYFIQVDGVINQEALNRLKAGVEIGFNGTRYMTKPCDARLLNHPPDIPPRQQKIRDDRHGPTSWASVTVTEGKFRQIRKMAAAVGFPVLRLIRVRIGNIKLEIASGEVIEVEQFEL